MFKHMLDEINDIVQCFSTPSPRKGLDESASTVAFTSSQFVLHYK